ncbi:MAG: hypothetical protein LLG04_03180 [Parachlamydia sp.]|nr:hypothetical protein [Parachlamydia sp.]
MNPKLDAHNLLNSRNLFLQQYHGSMRGYRTDMQYLLHHGKDLYPMRSAIHDLISTLFQDIIDKVPIGEKELSAAEDLFSDAQTRVIAYVKTKMDHTGTCTNLKSWDAWAKRVSDNLEKSAAEALFKASDHIEDTLFLAELSGALQLPTSLTHAHEEMEELLTKLNEYFALLPADHPLCASLSPALKELDNLYMQKNYAQELEKLKAIISLIRQ